jgi:hypothetical protein
MRNVHWNRVLLLIILAAMAFGGSFSECSCQYGSSSVQKTNDQNQSQPP